MSGTFDPYVSWLSQEEDGVRRVTAGIRDRPTVADLLAFLDREAGGMPLDEITLGGGHVRWLRDATIEERDERRVWRERAAEQQERWERSALARFLEKYGDPRG